MIGIKQTSLIAKGRSLYPTIANFEITTHGVYYILSIHKSPGPDGIYPYAYGSRETATEVSSIRMLTPIVGIT